jgi:hypothetical protein
MADDCNAGMIGNRNRPSQFFFLLPFLLLLFFCSAATSQTQTRPAPPPHPANDVVMVSLEALSSRAENQLHVRAGLLGDDELNVEKHLLETQMNIVRETAKFGPVLLLAPDETTKSAICQRCEEFQICALFKSDRVRIKVVVHDGLWIRD